MAILTDCPHNSDLGRYQNQTWFAPFSHCECCGVYFPYVDMASWSTNGGAHGRQWIPKTACFACGGKYVEF